MSQATINESTNEGFSKTNAETTNETPNEVIEEMADEVMSEPMSETMNETIIANWIIKYLKTRQSMPLETIDLNSSFGSLGLDSINQVELLAQLQSWMGCRIEPTLAYDFPTVGSLAKELAQLYCANQELSCESN